MSDEYDIERQLKEIREQRVNLGTGSGSSHLPFGRAMTENPDEETYDTVLTEEQEEDTTTGQRKPTLRKLVRDISAPKALLKDLPIDDVSHGRDDDLLVGSRRLKIAERESEYQRRRQNRLLSPERSDPFAHGHEGTREGRTYKDVLAETELNKQEAELKRKILQKEREKDKTTLADERQQKIQVRDSVEDGVKPVVKKKRWDMGTDEAAGRKSEWEDVDQGPSTSSGVIPSAKLHSKSSTSWDFTPSSSDTEVSATPKKRRWDNAATPATSNMKGESLVSQGWEQTPERSSQIGQTPRKSSRWDETPVSLSSATTQVMSTPIYGNQTVHGNMGLLTPSHNSMISAMMTPERMNIMKMEREMDARNRPITDTDLDAVLPPEGYVILEAPVNYIPLRTPSRKITATPTPYTSTTGFVMQTPEHRVFGDVALTAVAMAGDGTPASDAQLMKPEDYQYFSTLTDGKPDEDLTFEEIKERKIMRLLLKIKNGTPIMRKSALRQITEKARDFGAGMLFDKILPLLMSPSLEDQERHLLVKVIDRILYKLDDLVRPYVHKILVVIEPLLIDEDYYTRVEGREIISNLSKAAGLASMIAAMRPDIDHSDEYVRNTTARAFSVVASALGIPTLLPFIKAVCQSKKRWEARHTGIKIVQQIAILMGCAVLPHLKGLVEAIGPGLTDEQPKVRTITALALAALAEAATPYGIESFDSILKPLWKGIRQHRSKALAAFLKAIGYIIPLMDVEYASYYTKEILEILLREFATPDEEMKKIVLKVVKQTVMTDGVTGAFIKSEIMPEFFRHFWNRRMAMDKRSSKQVVETTAELANKTGVAEIIKKLVLDLKDESELYRKMVLEVMDLIVTKLGSADIDPRLEEQLIDGLLFAFQEQSGDDQVFINGFGTIVNSLGMRVKPYLQQICSTILWRLNNKSAKVRQQAADLVGKIASVMIVCHEEKLLNHLGLVLFEYLGEEYPDVLGSILGGLKGIVNVIGMNRMTPPIKDLLPRCTPILKNRHEKVQENCIELVGRIADRGPEHVSPREWMRICFELLELLKAHKKSIRRAAVNTFGYIAKAIGPQDVLAALLNNLKVQERQNRVCTTVAIAIVAENCSPFTILPALMNEYRVPEMNVQNGVLKSLAFLFEYIGEMGKDYIYAITPLLEDALMDRDLVHRQTAATAVKHLALGVYGLGCEDALLHLLNFVWPNVFETSAHVITAVLEAIDALRLSLGPGHLWNYLCQGLFHPARKVRYIYWKVFNNLYIAHQPALVPLYPDLEFDDTGKYKRHELELLL